MLVSNNPYNDGTIYARVQLYRLLSVLSAVIHVTSSCAKLVSSSVKLDIFPNLP